MILEAFWKGDSRRCARTSTAMSTTPSPTRSQQRETDGLMLDNRLVAIEQAVIAEADARAQASR